MKTPEQIRDMEFQSSPVGGYKKSDVDLFLEEVASEIEILMKQKLDVDRKLQEISKKAPEAALTSAGIQNVLVSAQRVAEQITDDARNQAETIIADANLKLTEAGMKAQEIISEAEKNASLLGKTAEVEATKIIAEAVKNAEEIVAAAKESVDLQQKLYDRLKIEVSDFKKKAVSQCAAVLELMNQLPDEIPFNIERAKTVLSIDFNDPAALLDNAVSEKLAQQKSEAEAAAAAELAKKEAEEQEKIAAALKAEADAAFQAEVVSSSSAIVEEPAVDEIPAVKESDDVDEYQLTFEEATAAVEEIPAVEEAPTMTEAPIKKGKISFGEDDEDDDEEDDENESEGFFFKKKKR